MDLKKVHDTIDVLLNKANQGMLTPAEKDIFLNRAQYELLGEIAPAYGVSQQLHDYLRPFRKKLTLTNSNTVNGVIAIPSDYYRLLAIELNTTTNGRLDYKAVPLLGDDEVSQRKNSQLIPAESNPFVHFDGTDLQLYPASETAGTMWYLKKPNECEFKYSQSGRTITYNAGTSVQLEWNDEAVLKIIHKALGYAGLNLKDTTAIQYSLQKEGGN